MNSLLSARDNRLVSEATKNSATNALPSHKLLDKKSIGEKTLEKTCRRSLLTYLDKFVMTSVCHDFRHLLRRQNRPCNRRTSYAPSIVRSKHGMLQANSPSSMQKSDPPLVHTARSDAQTHYCCRRMLTHADVSISACSKVRRPHPLVLQAQRFSLIVGGRSVACMHATPTRKHATTLSAHATTLSALSICVLHYYTCVLTAPARIGGAACSFYIRVIYCCICVLRGRSAQGCGGEWPLCRLQRRFSVSAYLRTYETHALKEAGGGA
jgi:hypothetical protein